MEKYIIDKDIRTACVTAATFPNGIEEAFQKLHSVYPVQVDSTRRYYGISYPDGKGSFVYKAAAELFDSETTDLEVFIIEQGPYISEIVYNFMQDIPAIAKTFHKLVEHPELKDPGYCVEYYYNDKDVCCMSQLNR